MSTSPHCPTSRALPSFMPCSVHLLRSASFAAIYEALLLETSQIPSLSNHLLGNKILNPRLTEGHYLLTPQSCLHVNHTKPFNRKRHHTTGKEHQGRIEHRASRIAHLVLLFRTSAYPSRIPIRLWFPRAITPRPSQPPTSPLPPAVPRRAPPQARPATVILLSPPPRQQNPARAALSLCVESQSLHQAMPNWLRQAPNRSLCALGRIRPPTSFCYGSLYLCP